MNRNDLKEYFARLKNGQQNGYVGDATKPSLLREQQDLKQSGQFTPEEYVLSSIVVSAWEAGARWATGNHTLQADRAAADLEDAIGDTGLLIPPVNEKTISDLESLFNVIEKKKSSGGYDNSFSRDVYSDSELQDMSGEGLDSYSQDIPDVDYEDEDTEEDDDPIRRMGFADYSQEYKDMVRSGKIYDK